jgi:hypothetical protein
MVYGIYFELANKDGGVYQALFIPPRVEANGTGYPPRLLFREIKPDRGKDPWTVKVAGNYIAPNRTELDDTDQLMRVNLRASDGLVAYFANNLIDPRYSLRASYPINLSSTYMVLVTESNDRVPPSLTALINEQRDAHELPALPGRM